MQQKKDNSVKTPKFPTQELNTWLRVHKSWDHNEWLALLAELRRTGYGSLTDNEPGRNSIGTYLEAHRQKG
jgi:hypothetical protein